MPNHPAARGIYLRGSVYWLNFQRNGKRLFVSLETSDFTEAIKRAQEIRAAPILKQGSPFADEIEAFLAYKRRKNQFTAASAQARGYILRAFARDIGKISPASITTVDVQRWYDGKLHKHSAVTANGYAMILRSFFNWCRDVARISRVNPVDNTELTQDLGTRMRDSCTEEQRDRLISTCNREDIAFVLYCGFHAGLRKNEIIETRPFWFDIPAGLLHLRKTATINFKDREERTIPLTQEFRKFLIGYGLREPFMLQPKVTHGMNRYRYDFSRPFKYHVTAHGLAWVTPHTMRRTFASLLASAGVSLYKIAKWLGDDPRVVERHYARLSPADADIDRAFSASMKSASAFSVTDAAAK